MSERALKIISYLVIAFMIHEAIFFFQYYIYYSDYMAGLLIGALNMLAYLIIFDKLRR